MTAIKKKFEGAVSHEDAEFIAEALISAAQKMGAGIDVNLSCPQGIGEVEGIASEIPETQSVRIISEDGSYPKGQAPNDISGGTFYGP